MPYPIVIIGEYTGSHLGGSLRRAAIILGLRVFTLETTKAQSGLRAIDAVAHKLRAPPVRTLQFEREVLRISRRERPGILIATGRAPLRKRALLDLRNIGVRTINYSTDDPWNPAFYAPWFIRALPFYDTIFTPRRSNLDEFKDIGCQHIRYLPFGYDPSLLAEVPLGVGSHDILLVGGADDQRVTFVKDLLARGINPTLVGSYWMDYPEMQPYALGPRTPQEIVALSRQSHISLIIVRKANRDGHVMRSFEAAAIGGCLVVEDTADHREIFGPNGDCVHYFTDAAQAATVCRALLDNSGLRHQCTVRLAQRISSARHTYVDRLQTMVQA